MHENSGLDSPPITPPPPPPLFSHVLSFQQYLLGEGEGRRRNVFALQFFFNVLLFIYLFIYLFVSLPFGPF